MPVPMGFVASQYDSERVMFTMSVSLALRNIETARQQFAALAVRLREEQISKPEDIARGRIVLAGLVFCQQSCRLAHLALQQQCWLHEMVLVRPVLETSVRLLFATRVPDGWNRYDRYWAEQEREWAVAAKEQFPARPSWDAWLQDAEAKCAALPVKPMNYKLNNALQAIIDTERAAMIAGGEGAHAPDERGDVAHLMLFKLAHHVTHGNPEYLVNNLDAQLNDAEFVTGSAVLFMQAAYMMTRAVYFHRGWPDREADAMAFVKTAVLPDRSDSAVQ